MGAKNKKGINLLKKDHVQVHQSLRPRNGHKLLHPKLPLHQKLPRPLLIQTDQKHLQTKTPKPTEHPQPNERHRPPTHPILHILAPRTRRRLQG